MHVKVPLKFTLQLHAVLRRQVAFQLKLGTTIKECNCTFSFFPNLVVQCRMGIYSFTPDSKSQMNEQHIIVSKFLEYKMKNAQTELTK